MLPGWPESTSRCANPSRPEPGRPAVPGLGGLFISLALLFSALKEFGNLQEGILELAEVLVENIELESEEYAREILTGIAASLYHWWRGVFIEQELGDVHFYDDSIIADCLQAKVYLTDNDEKTGNMEMF